jgi:hypothetical protein
MKKRSMRNLRLIFIALIVFMIILLLNPTLADECRGNSCNRGTDVNVGGADVNVGGDTVNVGGDTVNVGGDTINVGGSTLTGGDVSVPVNTGPVNQNVSGGNYESRALALANSLGDVDIADCLGSHQWSTPVFGRQDLKLNQVCMAEFYLRTGKYELAAMSLCNVKEILKEFESEEQCESAHDFTPRPVAAVDSVSDRQQIELYHEEDIEAVQMAQMSLEQRLASLESRPAEVVEIVKPVLTDEQKQQVWEALTGSEDEDDR